jgi:hypothetical protein
MRRLLLLPLLLASCACAADTHEITLPHLTLRWTAGDGLEVLADGQQLLTLPVAPVVAHPPAWTWSYTGREGIKAELSRQGEQQTLTVTCPDPKLPWTQTIVAGPGDKYSVTYKFRQLAWDEPMEYEVCAAQPTPLFVGGAWTAQTPAGEKTGVIPLQFDGNGHPYGAATAASFAVLPGRFAYQATEPLTLYDYKARHHFWLGRDGPMPKGEEQTWAVDFSFVPQPFAIGGVEITHVRVPLRPAGETSEVSLDLRQLADGPGEVTATWGERKEGATPARQTVKLTDKPQTVHLAVKLPEPGTYALGFDLLQGQTALYASPALSVTIPRLLAVKATRIPFTPQDEGALLVRVDPVAGDGLTVTVAGGGANLFAGAIKAGPEVTVPIALAKLPLGRVPLDVTLTRNGQRLFGMTYPLLLAAPNPNGVVIDNRSRTLLVAGLPYCPQSCYADMRSVDAVIETEPVFGFNTIAPYLSTSVEQRRDRTRVKQMLDRCAQVGLRVQLAVHGASRPPHTDEKWQWLKEEIEAFRDHPALLSYYLADEPELGWAKPEDCELAYGKIKALDPWHPVTMVFCQSAAAVRYARGMDVCMTDPYPIPYAPVTNVAEYCDRINRDLGRMLPLWVVPQAFGGGEGWKREPSRQEERVMTYLALIHGATGIQYFIRRPPAVNPNSPDLWSECRRLMFELSQLTPALAGERLPWPGEARQPAPIEPDCVQAAAFQERGALTVLCANVKNEPQPLQLALPVTWSGRAEVLFENRTVPVQQGRLRDVIDAMSTRAYRLQVAAPPADLATLDTRNMIVNPSWEEAANVGTPDGCYIGYGSDQAATWYVDPRQAAHGRQSLRLRTPVEGQGIGVNPFPLRLTPKQKYVLAIWARGERAGQKFSFTLDTVKPEQGTHELTTGWREYRVEFTAGEPAKARTSPRLSLISAGSAWFDALQVVPVP